MNHYLYSKKDSYKICFLVNQIQLRELEKEYFEGLNKEDILILDLYKDPKKKKTSVSDMKEYLQDVQETLAKFNVEYVIICNSEYYKVFTKQTKADVNIGYIKEVDNYKVIYCPDFKSIFYDPIRVREKIKRSLFGLIVSYGKRNLCFVPYLSVLCTDVMRTGFNSHIDNPCFGVTV